VSQFHAEAPQATVSEGLAQGPYVAARAGFEPATIRTRDDESTNEPPCPHRWTGKQTYTNRWTGKQTDPNGWK